MNDLINQLRDENVTGFNLTVAACEAADRIEQLQRENSELRFALADTEALELGTAERLAEAKKLIEQLQRELETERVLSFRNQVAELEKQRDELLAAAKIILSDAPLDNGVMALAAAVRNAKQKPMIKALEKDLDAATDEATRGEI